MSNVVHLNVPSPKQREADRLASLLTTFAEHRRIGDDVFWLKENAELLNILECTGTKLDASALDAHAGFYARVEKRLGFFPQYYRFLLSICLDLEDLGMAGHKGEFLVSWLLKQGVVEAEMSDLQRGEAQRLMLRRGVDPLGEDPGLKDRLRAFVNRSTTFAMPNKKAAYELTHTVFYLSEYGRKCPDLGENARQSLDFAGTLAFLDQNADLLAEVCVAMQYAGMEPPEVWKSWLFNHLDAFACVSSAHTTAQDDYHEFFTCNWFLANATGQIFENSLSPGRMAFFRPKTATGPLREMSECLFRLGEQRCDDWGRMRVTIASGLSEEAFEIMSLAETSSDCFERFFAGFARVGLQGALL